MATEKVKETYAAMAGANLTGKLYYLATVNSDEEIVLAGDGGVVMGSIYEEAVEGKPATIVIDGIMKVIFAAALAAGARVASDTDGKGVTPAVGDFTIGTVVEGTDGANQIGSVLISPGTRHA